MHRQEEARMLSDLLRTSRDASSETLSLARERLDELQRLMGSNAPEGEPGRLAGFWRVNLTVEGMKTQIAQMIEANSHAEDLRALVDDALRAFDFRGKIRAAVNEHLSTTLSKLIASLVQSALYDPAVEAAVKNKVRIAVLNALKSSETEDRTEEEKNRT